MTDNEEKTSLDKYNDTYRRASLPVRWSKIIILGIISYLIALALVNYLPKIGEKFRYESFNELISEILKNNKLIIKFIIVPLIINICTMLYFVNKNNLSKKILIILTLAILPIFNWILLYFFTIRFFVVYY